MSTYVETQPVAPTTGWRRVFGDWLVVGSATTVCHALGAVTSLWLRMALSPAQMGVWQAAKLLLSYGNYANLGISKGAAREFNVALGRGDTQAARHGLKLAFTVNTLSSLLYAAVLLGAAVLIGRQGTDGWDNSWSLALASAAVLAVVSRYVTFHVTILRSGQAFAATSRLSLLEAVLTLAVAGSAAWLWGLPGLYAGTLIVLLGSMFFVRRHALATLRFAWDPAEMRRLIAIGGPILLAGTVGSLLRSLDKLMILAYLSDRAFQLGCYSVSLMVTAQLFGLGNMLSLVTGPRYGEAFGRSNDRAAVARLAARATELHAAALALPAALALVAGPPILVRLLPDYQSGLPPLVWLVPGVFALCLALPASQYLVAVGRQRRALSAVIVATIVAALGNHAALVAGYGLVGVATATCAAYGVYFVLVVALSLWPELDAAARLRYVAMVALGALPTLGVALAMVHTPAAERWDLPAVRLLIVLGVWVLTVAIGWHHGGWKTAMSDRPVS